MTNYSCTIYSSAADLKAAVDAIANTATIMIIPYMEGGRQKFLLIQ